ncbi:MAG: hypothetical protein HQL31_03325 [Planctomycetes bacterium]|nr:hypothetical protein [Planctomycetota bacterium]
MTEQGHPSPDGPEDEGQPTAAMKYQQVKSNTLRSITWLLSGTVLTQIAQMLALSDTPTEALRT